MLAGEFASLAIGERSEAGPVLRNTCHIYRDLCHLPLHLFQVSYRFRSTCLFWDVLSPVS
jgi:hypothetical protein